MCIKTAFQKISCHYLRMTHTAQIEKKNNFLIFFINFNF